jgi:hypothetical protein
VWAASRCPHYLLFLEKKEREMKLYVIDRVSLLSILPEKGDFLTLKIIRQLREELSFSEEEIKALRLTSANGSVTWNAAADSGKDVQIGEKATDLIVDTLKKINEKKELTQQLFGLYAQFVGE